MRIFYGLIGLCFWWNSIYAEQLKFEKKTSNSSINLSYQWLDHQKQARQIAFSLDKKASQSHYRNQTDYKPQIAQRYVYVELMKAAQQVNPKEARINMVQRGDRIEVSVKSRSAEMREKWIASMSEKRESAFTQYLTDNHYTRFENYMGQIGVIPDHVRYVQESRPIILPVAQAIYNQLEEGSDTRDYVNRLLSWVQSIPYDTLESRIDSSGAGFYTPVEVLVNNKGDCDSKAALTASLMRSLLPDLSMSIVYLPGHALLAVNLGQRPNEMSVELRGTNHVLLEPTGPAKVAIGVVSDETARHIANGSYRAVSIP